MAKTKAATIEAIAVWEQFPHTVYTDKQIAEEEDDILNNDDIGETIFGETINRNECSCDSCHIYDPSFNSIDAEKFRFMSVADGEYNYSKYLESIFPRTVIVVSMVWLPSWVIKRLCDHDRITFLGNPATGRQYRVNRKGEVFIKEQSCEEYKSNFFIGSTNWCVYLMTKQSTTANIWWDTNVEEPKSSLWNIAYLTRVELLIAKDIFDGLNRMPDTMPSGSPLASDG